MDQRPGLPYPEFLQMPLRDVARGLKEAAHLTEGALAPVVSSLPEPLQTALSEAVTTLKSQGKSALSLDVTADDVATASRFIAGYATADGATFAKVISFAWDHLKQGGLVSETILASHLGQASSETKAPEDQAAALVHRMGHSHAFGKMPGLPVPEGDDNPAEIMVALVAPMAWLLAEREGSLQEELHVLDLARALSRVFEEDIRSAVADETALAPLLKTLASHL